MFEEIEFLLFAVLVIIVIIILFLLGFEAKKRDRAQFERYFK
jgi:hypothetical protein